MTQTPVLIVSAFGRGHTLAEDLARSEIPVTLIDVSGCLGEVSAEDDEGPFGFFSHGLSHAEGQRLLEDHPPLLQVNGFTWMLETGPFEMKGPLTAFHCEKLRIPPLVWRAATEDETLGSREHNFLLNGDFDRTWLFHLGRSFFANVMRPNFRAGLVPHGQPFTGDFFVRSMSRAGLKKSFEAVERSGIRVFVGAQILDAGRRSSSLLQSIEFKRAGSDTAELIEAEQFVWFLSGEETEKVSGRLQEKIFPHGVVRPEMCWLRLRVKIPSVAQRESLPLHSVWVKDRALPWSHENLFVLMRTSNAESFDIWFRIPEMYRLQRDYVLSLIDNIRAEIEQRLDFSGLQILDLPVSVTKQPQEIGPSRHPLYSEDDLAEFLPPKWKNFHWSGLETAHGAGWNALLLRSRGLGVGLKKWWEAREAERIRKEEASKKGTGKEV